MTSQVERKTPYLVCPESGFTIILFEKENLFIHEINKKSTICQVLKNVSLSISLSIYIYTYLYSFIYPTRFPDKRHNYRLEIPILLPFEK